MAGADAATVKDKDGPKGSDQEKGPGAGPVVQSRGGLRAPPLRAPAARKPRAATDAAVYWLGLLPKAPASFVTAPGVTFHRHTGQLIDDEDPEQPKHMNRSTGGLASLLPEQVDAILAWAGQRIWRFRGDTNDGAMNISVDDPEYGSPQPRDLPLGRFLFMVKSQHFGDPRLPLPEPMA